jgi:hypothetical protein
LTIRLAVVHAGAPSAVANAALHGFVQTAGEYTKVAGFVDRPHGLAKGSVS